MDLVQVGLQNVGVFRRVNVVDKFAVLAVEYFHIKTIQLQQDYDLSINDPFADVHTVTVKKFKLFQL